MVTIFRKDVKKKVTEISGVKAEIEGENGRKRNKMKKWKKNKIINEPQRKEQDGS